MTTASFHPALKQVAGGAILFIAMMAFGLVTRPVAFMLPMLYGFHAVLVALPSAWAIALCLRKGVLLPTCFISVALFSAVLFSMSPIMGLSSLLPMIGALFAFAIAAKWAPQWKAWAVGFTYGLLFYPCTIIVSLGFGSLARIYLADSMAAVVVSALIGAALAALGATLASRVPRTQGKQR